MMTQEIFQYFRHAVQNQIRRLLLILLVFFLASPCGAVTLGPAQFNESWQKGPFKMRLIGAGLKKFLAVKVVAAGFYLPEDASSEQALEDIPKRLEMVYLQNIPRVELQRATLQGIRKNVTAREFRKLRDRIDQINAQYPNVRPGDRISVTYLPGRGTLIDVNGSARAVIQGEDFAQAFYAIWVGKRPVDRRIKEYLLGERPAGETDEEGT